MPKLKNVTQADLKVAEDRAFELSQDLHFMAETIQKGYADEFESPLGLASAFLSLSRSAGDLAAMLLSKAKLQEIERETRTLILSRQKGA